MWGRDGLYAGFCTGSGYPIAGDDHPSRSTVADALTRPTRLLGRTALIRSLSGLAPGGVYRAAPVTWGAGGLLHHLFTLTRTRRAVYFLWHYPAGFPEWALPTTLFCGARTFLGPLMRHAVAWSSHSPFILRAAPATTAISRCRMGSWRLQAAFTRGALGRGLLVRWKAC